MELACFVPLNVIILFCIILFRFEKSELHRAIIRDLQYCSSFLCDKFSQMTDFHENADLFSKKSLIKLMRCFCQL